MNKLPFLAVMLAVSGQVRSDEVEDYCNLTKAQTEAKSVTLAWPKLFASVGDPYASGGRIIGGISQSFSGLIQALTMNDVSYNQCRFYGTNKLLRENVLHLEDKIFLMQADAQRPILADALKLAEKNVEIEKQLFDTQNSTIAELSTAYAMRDSIQLSQLTLEQKYSALREIPVIETGLNLREQVAKSKAYQAKAASLASAINTLSAWDVVASAGAKYDIQPGTTGGFATISLTYSFGHIPSAMKTSKVDGLVRKYVDAQHDSPENMFLRFIHSEKENLLSEGSNNKYLENQLKSIRELLDRANTVDSIRAKRVQRNLTIQQLTQKAALVASTVKMQELEKWLRANAE